jgi:hypothetical protein
MSQAVSFRELGKQIVSCSSSSSFFRHSLTFGPSTRVSKFSQTGNGGVIEN